MLGLLLSVLIGALAGLLLNLIIGIVGGFLGGWLFGLIGIGGTSILWQLISATVGSIVLLWIISLIKK